MSSYRLSLIASRLFEWASIRDNQEMSADSRAAKSASCIFIARTCSFGRAFWSRFSALLLSGGYLRLAYIRAVNIDFALERDSGIYWLSKKYVKELRDD